MKNLQMPHSYISVSEEELRSISGGGPLGDALDLFFSNLRLDDLFFSGGLISLSFTFVPMLLFNVVKTGFNFVGAPTIPSQTCSIFPTRSGRWCSISRIRHGKAGKEDERSHGSRPRYPWPERFTSNVSQQI